MYRSVRQICFFVLFGVFAAQLPAQISTGAVSAANQNLTAEQIAVAASLAYQKTQYAEALALYKKFIESFGEAKEAQAAIREMRYPMAMCLFHLKKFSDAVEAIDIALGVQPALDEYLRQDLTFWKGVCLMQEEDTTKARECFEKFITMFPPGAENQPSYIKSHLSIQKIPEAKLLIGQTYLIEDKYKEGADYLAKIKPSLIPVNRGRATVMQLRALIEADDNEGALKLVMEEYPHMADLMQLVTFQTLTLQLGSLFLEKKEPRKAIICLQRIWDSDRLIKHQRERLADLESRLAAASANPNSDPYEKFVLVQLINSVKHELKNFAKIPNFDSALRLRLAYAFQVMERYRECALVLEAMLKDMPPDPVVESASVNLVQCWGVIEQWPKVVESAEIFVDKFPKSKSVPMVLYLEGAAQQKEFDYDGAIASYDRVLKDFPTSDYAPRALFMKGFTLLLADRSKEGIECFEQFQTAYPNHEMADANAYWRGMGYSLDKQFEKCRSVMGDYLTQRKDGAFRDGAIYRRAYCLQQLEKYDDAIKEFTAYLKAYPNAEDNSEARMLLGDALMNQGRMEDGITSLKSIPSTIADQGMYEEAVFKIGKAYKLMEEPQKYREEMELFIKNSPRSPRVAEAIFNIGWVERQDGHMDKARNLYWNTIDKYGNDPEIRSVEDLFPAVAKLYKGGDDSGAYTARLHDIRIDADRTGKKTLAMRALWAEAALLRKADPAKADQLLAEAAARADITKTSPALLADFATALAATGKEKESEQMWRDLVKWNPRAPQKDRAFAALGFVELKNGDEKKALDYFNRFEAETNGSLLFGKVMLAKANLLISRGDVPAARKSLETLLAAKSSSGNEKAEALCLMGDLYMKEGKPNLAVPYYQRTYVMYGRWRDWVAKAYLRSGEAFEKLDDKMAARKTYQELTENTALSDLKESQQALLRLNAIGGPLPKAEPTPSATPDHVTISS